MAAKTPTIAAGSPPSAPVVVRLLQITQRLYELRDLAYRHELARARRTVTTPAVDPTPPVGWVTVDRAAAYLDTTPRALRKRLGRVARKAADGSITAKVSGLEAKKLGESWRVHFPPSWRKA